MISHESVARFAFKGLDVPHTQRSSAGWYLWSSGALRRVLGHCRASETVLKRVFRAGKELMRADRDLTQLKSNEVLRAELCGLDPKMH